VTSGKIYIGTSGWVYKDWASHFYPKEIPKKRHLEFYATQFPTVEINATFYRLPAEKVFQNWSEAAPPEFIYAVKGSRAVTHMKRLKPGAKSFPALLERCQYLGPHLGPILWQLPEFSQEYRTINPFFAAVTPPFFSRHRISSPDLVGPRCRRNTQAIQSCEGLGQLFSHADGL